MPGCNGDCNVSSLLVDFCRSEAVSGIALKTITAAIGRLCAYAQEANKLLCEIGMDAMHGFVQHLYSLENAGRTKEDSEQETYIVMQFYDFLVSQGCMATNPLRELKAAAIQQLLEKVEEKINDDKNGL
jgi:site-specific recombinase XerD